MLELVPHERIRHTDKFDDPNLPGEMQTTITLKKVSCGTELNIVQEGHTGCHPARGVLSRLARVAHPAGEARRGRDQGVMRAAGIDVREGGFLRISLTYDEPKGRAKTTARTDTYHGHFVKLVLNERAVR